MNLKKVLTSVVPVFVAVLIIVIAAVVITSSSKAKPDPMVSESDSSYVTVTSPDGKMTFSITKGEMYKRLKANYGADEVINQIDTYLLKNTKNEDGVSYFDLVKEEEIDEALDKEVFKDTDKTKLDEEQISEANAKFLETVLLSGYKSLEDYKEKSVRLTVAKKLYANDVLLKKIAEKDSEAKSDSDKYYTDSKINVEYENSYKDNFFTIFVKYQNEEKAKEALKQVGVKIDTATQEGEDSVVYDTWRFISNDEELSVKDVIETFIKLYNNQNQGFATNYPESREILTLGEDYTVEDGNIVFNTVLDENGLNDLYFEYNTLSKISSLLYSNLSNKFEEYKPVAVGEESSSQMVKAKWYTPKVETYSSEAYFVLKIATVKKAELADVKQEIIDKFVEKELTDSLIKTTISDLRKDNDVVIYDNEIEEVYMSSNESYKENKKTNGNVIATVKDLEITTETLFASLDEKYGMQTLKDLSIQSLFLHSDLNTYYDSTNKKVLDNKKWKEMAQKVFEAKQSFNTSYYAYYYSWDDYCRLAYGTNNIEELKEYFLYSSLVSDYATKLGLSKDSINDKYEVELSSDDTTKWNETLAEMKKQVAEYYNLSYMQIVITAKKKDSTETLDFSEWSSYQKALAEIAVDSIKAYLDAEEGENKTKLEAIVKAYNEAPYLSSLGDVAIVDGVLNVSEDAMPFSEEISYVENGVPVSAIKSAGLVLKFENEASYTNTTSYVQDFLDAGKWIWNNVSHDDYKDTPYVLGRFEVNNVVKDYLTTSYGYHLYINTKITDSNKIQITDENSVFLGNDVLKYSNGAWLEFKAEKDVEYDLPSINMILAYLKDSSDENVTKVKNLTSTLTTYYTPINTEVVGATSSEISVINWLKQNNINLEKAGYTVTDLNNYFDLRLNSLNDSLKFFKEDK